MSLDSSWNVMAHGDAREGKWKGNCRMEWVASTLHTTSEHGVYSITTADAHSSAASIRLNWRARRFKWTRPFCRKTKSGFCECVITFQPDCIDEQTKFFCILPICLCNLRYRLAAHSNALNLMCDQTLAFVRTFHTVRNLNIFPCSSAL